MSGRAATFKVLILDIETRPNLAYVWALWDQNIGLNQIVDTGCVISFAAKWHGKKPVTFFSDFYDGHDVMVSNAYDLLDEADAVVHFNGKSFDIKHLQREFVLAGLSPPRPHKDIDLLTVARGQFKFASNKLQHISEQLGLGSKVKTDFDLWADCMADDPVAWAAMKKYNIQDVRLTERLYDRLLPWIKGHPSRALYAGEYDAKSCPNCGGTDLKPRGYAYTQVGAFHQYRCETCGTWSRGGKRAGGVDLRRST